MLFLNDYLNRTIRFTDERLEHIETNHPEMLNQLENCRETILHPDIVIRSKTDTCVELFYRFYESTPIGKKYLCVVVKNFTDDLFVITSYFTDTIKKGEILWEKK